MTGQGAFPGPADHLTPRAARTRLAGCPHDARTVRAAMGHGMATKILKTSKRTVTLDARPDRPDLGIASTSRRWSRSPSQFPPPDWIKTYLPRYSKAGLILDQGEEGACTGFGLAAVINYLPASAQSVRAKTPTARRP